jgi:hypothetical protein
MRRRQATPERLGCPSATTCRWHWRTRALSQGAIGAPASAFAVVEPQFHWKIRAGAGTQGESFLNRHANATIVDPVGLEVRRDVCIGVSLMAPHMRYPGHRHPPEDIYVMLADGHWAPGERSKHEPSIGGPVYNPPNVVHARTAPAGALVPLDRTDQPLISEG